MAEIKNFFTLNKVLLSLVLLFFLGCNSRKVTCETVQYTAASVENKTTNSLDVTFCSPEVEVPKESKTVPAMSPMEAYTVEVGSRNQQVEIPYADSSGDGCAKMGASSEYLGKHVPMLSASDLTETKTCSDGEKYIFIETSQGCPSGFNDFDQSTVDCK